MKNIVEENDMPKVKNKLWIWGHAANVHYNRYGIGKTSRMTPGEGAVYLGTPNLIMVYFGGKPTPPV